MAVAAPPASQTDELDHQQLLRVLMAVKRGDFSARMPDDLAGTGGKIADTLNDIISRQERLAKELYRISLAVGKEGKFSRRVKLSGELEGGWNDILESTNTLIVNLVQPTREFARVIGLVASGDLAHTVPLEIDGQPLEGEFLRTAKVTNTMVDQLNAFSSEVTRVAREVGTEGILGGQASVEGVSGVWKELTDSVNQMASNLTSQVRNIAEVTTAVANGDLSRKITVDVQGEIRDLKNTINTMVDQLNAFSSEVTRVAREVGTEGLLGGQASVEGVSGVWKDLTESVNQMASNLTSQVRNIAEVTTAVANGDLSRKITVDVHGEIRDLKNTINTMVDQLNAFSSEVTRVAREVGTEGLLGGQASVEGVSGVWKDLTESVNHMASNLTSQVRNIAEVTTAVATGDLSRKITVDVQGEILDLKNTINTMVDQLNAFASEVTRVAREVGTEGLLGGQADVRGVGGVWKELTDSVNQMASNLTSQVRNIAEVTTAVANGDLSRKITVDVQGEIRDLKNTINTMVDQLNAFSSEVTRVAREVGTEGRLGVQADVRGVAGVWKDLTDSVNQMASNLTSQVRNIAEVTTAVANGDLSRKITVDVQGEIRDLKNTINTMVDQLNAFASEVTRVAREVGTEGLLGGQADVRGVGGVWKDLTESVNQMASNLTAQVRGIAQVVTAIANGNLKQKLSLEAQGEIAALAETINEMIDTLATFADQVTSVAREVGTEGKLGGQAEVPGASGIWRDLTTNVNQLAANLTTQVRAIADVATAVTAGDLSRSIAVEAQGELSDLKDNINQMIFNLRETTRRNTEEDWLKTNLTRFTRMLQGQRDLQTVAKQILSELASLVNAQHGVFYMANANSSNGDTVLRLLSSYAYRERKHLANSFRLGEGLVGQAALEQERILLTSVPDDYIKINSALGESTPLNVVVLPVVFEHSVKAVIELASFYRFSDIHLTFMEQLTESIAIVLNTLEANSRTEELLKQSQALTEELQGQQQELTETNRRLEDQARTLQASEELLKKQREQLQQTNEELEEKAELLESQNREVERKNNEIEQARRALEEKAEQLALTSRYKSEFLANMSHELRTPLNSMLILSRLLSENNDQTLNEKQIEFAETIHEAGADLLSLINDILDLAKIESGTMGIDVGEVDFVALQEYVERTFLQVAEDKDLRLSVTLGNQLPQTMITDPRRLQQVLRNLISNALKFTEKGEIELRIDIALEGWSIENDKLNRTTRVIAFAVRDTGIGIPADKQMLIFEAFQQVDGTTSRTYGGTGLGLSISREIAQLLGGEIRLESIPGKGSTFTLYLPQFYAPETRKLVEQQPQPLLPPAAQPIQESHDYDIGAIPQVVEDDRDALEEGDRVLLIIDDDQRFARIMVDLAHEKGFKALVATQGEHGLALAQYYKPDAITLDIRLPLMDGWTVLDRLKHDPTIRHIPVHVISVEEGRQRSLHQGAMAYLQKPVTRESLDEALNETRRFIERRVRNLLIVEDDEVQQLNIREIIGDGNDVQITVVGTGAAALEAMQNETFDCMVLDLGLPDMTGFQLIEKIESNFGLVDLPIIVYTAKELSPREETQLKRVAETIIVKDVRSMDRLLAETALFLHRVEANLPQSKQRMLQQGFRREPGLQDRKVLIVDDDVRNIFALTSVLERHQMEVVYAENGRDGIHVLQATPAIDLVLMDIMMPGMDGYETIREIRALPDFKQLPIIALTAKAMKSDREKCIEAGASDYITKPVDTDQLLSLLRVWLYR